jgi:hypothetical protein
MRTICANCSQPIAYAPARHAWYHLETGLDRCPMEFFAIPRRREETS